MIAFIIYLFAFLCLVYKTDFFGLLKDEKVKPIFFTFLFLLKALAVPIFYIVYKKLYGGVEKFDAGKFYNDAVILNRLAIEHPADYLKLLLGLQDESQDNSIYYDYIANTSQWENGRIKDFFYNDNRIVIRVHSLLHFIAFKSYFVHALFNCFLSFVGIVFFYKAIKGFFIGKEKYILVILCFLPALWFYTGGLLKEGLVIFILGQLLFTLKKLFSANARPLTLAWLCFLIIISLLLKPYLLFFAAFLFSIFFRIYFSKKIKCKTLTFISALALVFFALNTSSILFKKKSLMDSAIRQQRIFADASTGGIFLLDSIKFVRLDFDSSLVKRVNSYDSIFTIKKNASYIYWEHTHQQDTLFTKSNNDTITRYKLVYQLPKSGSNIYTDYSSKNIFEITCSSIYHSLFYPLFFSAKTPLQYLASFENLLIVLSLIIFISGLVQDKKDRFLPISFVVFAILLCLLIGITTPNSGAIFRYRSPAMPFILLAALYYFPFSKNKGRSRFN